MKITTTLLTLIQRLDKAEIRGFQAYLKYKKRKRVLELFNVFVLYKDEEELSYQIKRKKLVKNLRHNQKELFKLLRQFWTDNTKVEKPEIEINSLLNFAAGVYEKGLTEEALKLLKKAEEIAKTNNLHHLVYHCNRQWVTWNWRHYPDQTEGMMADYTAVQQHNINQISITSRVTYLNQRIFYLFFKGLWALTEEQMQFLENVSQEIVEILESEDIQVNYQIAMLGLASTHSRLIKMDGALAADYGRKALAVLNSCPPNFPGKAGNLATGYCGQLITLMLIKPSKEYEQTYADFEVFSASMEKPGVSIRYQILSTRLFHLRYKFIFGQQMNDTLEEVQQFLENEGKKLPPVFLGHFYMVVFELYYSSGQFDKAMHYVENLQALNRKNDLPDIKFMELLGEVFLNYEAENFDFIVNRCLSFRRRYSKYLRYNPAGRLIISYFIKLSNVATERTLKVNLYNKFKLEIEPVLQNIRNRNLLTFWNIIPWIDAKINQTETIAEWIKLENTVLD